MSRLRSFATLVWLVHSFAMPVTEDDDDDGCWSQPAAEPPTAARLAPYERTPTPHPSPATLPVLHRSPAPVLGTVLGILAALVACVLAACYVIRRRRSPPKLGFHCRRGSGTSKRRLSDESWVSPALPVLGSPGSPLSQDVALRQHAYPKRKLVLVTTPVTTPTDTEFSGGISVPPVRVPSPVYIPPSASASSSLSLSPAPSADPLPIAARFSRLLSSTFRDTRVADSPARPTTAHLIQTARSYAHAYRPSSTTGTSLYTPPTASVRLTGTRSRTSFYDACDPPWDRARDTLSTVTTSDTVCTMPHPLCAVAQDPPSRGTLLGLKLRLSDASEHARFRLCERQREHRRRREKEGTGSESKWRDSESVLRELGW